MFLCLAMWKRGIGNADDADKANANGDDGQSMIVKGSLVDKPNKPKITTQPSKIMNILNMAISFSIC